MSDLFNFPDLDSIVGGFDLNDPLGQQKYLEELKRKKEEEERRNNTLLGHILKPFREVPESDPSLLHALSSGVGALFESGKAPVDYVASKSAGLENIEPVEELLANALTPERSIGDIPEEKVNLPLSARFAGSIPETTTSVTDEEKKAELVQDTITRSLEKNIGGFALNPFTWLMGLPGAAGKVASASFIPGMAESGGEGIGLAIAKGIDQEKPEEAIDPLISGVSSLGFAGLGAKHLGTKGPHEIEPIKDQIIDTQPNPRVEIDRPAYVPNPNGLDFGMGSPFQDFAKVASEGLESIRDKAADLLSEPSLRETELAKTSGPSSFDADLNRINLNPQDVGFRSSRIDNLPEDAAYVITHELAHSKGEHAHRGKEPTEISRPEGDREIVQYEGNENINKHIDDIGNMLRDMGFSEEDVQQLQLNYNIPHGKDAFKALGEGKNADAYDQSKADVEFDPAILEHNRENIDKRAAISAEEHKFQTAMDTLQHNPEIIDALDAKLKDLNDPKYSITLPAPFDLPVGKSTITGNRLSIDEPTPKSSLWRVTLSDGTTRKVEAKDRGEAAQIVKGDLKAIKADHKVIGISPWTSEMKEGEIREGMRPNQVKFEIKLSDGSIRTMRGYSENSVASKVEAALKEAGVNDVKVQSVNEIKGSESKPREKKEPPKPAEQRLTEGELTKEDILRLARDQALTETGKAESKTKGPISPVKDLPSPFKDIKLKQFLADKGLTPEDWFNIKDRKDAIGLLNEFEKAKAEGISKAKANEMVGPRPDLIEKYKNDKHFLRFLKTKGISFADWVNKPEAAASKYLDEFASFKDKVTSEEVNIPDEVKALLPPKKRAPKSEKVEAVPPKVETKSEEVVSGRPEETPERLPEGVDASNPPASKKETISKPPKEPPIRDEEIGGEREDEAPKRNYKVTLSDGSEHNVRATSPEGARQKAEAILDKYGSSKKVDKVEERLSSLEKAAKHEIDPLKQGIEEVADIAKGQKETVKEESQFQKKSYTVTLTNGKKITVKARNIERARQLVENRAKRLKSNLTVAKIEDKLSPLDRELTGAKTEPPRPETGVGSITPEDTFVQAWKKLTPGQRTKDLSLGLIKAMRASADLGHIMRQGQLMTIDFLTTGHTKEFISALKEMGKGAFSEKEFKEINDRYASDPEVGRFINEFGLDLPGIAGHLKEEVFHAGLPEKIPGLGFLLLKPSERVYTGYLNAARVSKAKILAKLAEKEGYNMNDNPDVYKSIMKAVNIMGSRGDFKRIGPTLNSLSDVMWAPRLKVARVQLLTTAAGAGEMHPLARRELRKSLARSAAFNGTLLGLAALAGANIVTDPDNSDFLKIKAGSTRIDPWMGLQPIVRAAWQMHSQTQVSPTTGSEKRITLPEVIGKQIVSGLAPGPSYAYEMSYGKNVFGYDIDRSERAWLGLSPLLVEDVYDAMKEYGVFGIGAGVPGMIGYGVNTYSPNTNKGTKKKKKNTRKPSGIPW